MTSVISYTIIVSLAIRHPTAQVCSLLFAAFSVRLVLRANVFSNRSLIAVALAILERKPSKKGVNPGVWGSRPPESLGRMGRGGRGRDVK